MVMTITSVIGPRRRRPRLSIQCIMIIAVTFMFVSLITLHPSNNEQHEEEGAGTTTTHLLLIPDYEQHQKQNQQGKQQQHQRELIAFNKNVTNSSRGSAMSMSSPSTTTILANEKNVESNSKISTISRTFLFVHVGKAGGSTIANNIRPLCQRKQNRESILQEKQIGRAHV